jgi:hypothetical protein
MSATQRETSGWLREKSPESAVETGRITLNTLFEDSTCLHSRLCFPLTRTTSK